MDGNQASNSDDRIGRICRIDNGSGQESEHGLDSGQWWISDFTKLENIRSSFYYSLLSGVIVDDKNVQVFHFLIQWALSTSQFGSVCGLRGVLCWQRPCCNNNATQNICILLTCHFFSKNRFWYFWRFFDDLQKANRCWVKWGQLFYQAIIEFRRTLTRH